MIKEQHNKNINNWKYIFTQHRWTWMKQILINIKRKIYSNTILVGDSNTCLHKWTDHPDRKQLLWLNDKVMSESSVTPWTVPYQALSTVRFLRQEYWLCCHLLLQGIFLTQRSSPCFLHWWAASLTLSHQGSPYITFCPKTIKYIFKCTWNILHDKLYSDQNNTQ